MDYQNEKKNKFKPYVRRMNGKEKAMDFRTACRLAFYQDEPKAYVLVQRGFPNRVLAVEATKKNVENSIMVVGFGKHTFNSWANLIKRRAQKFGDTNE